MLWAPVTRDNINTTEEGKMGHIVGYSTKTALKIQKHLMNMERYEPPKHFYMSLFFTEIDASDEHANKKDLLHYSPVEFMDSKPITPWYQRTKTSSSDWEVVEIEGGKASIANCTSIVFMIELKGKLVNGDDYHIKDLIITGFGAFDDPVLGELIWGGKLDEAEHITEASSYDAAVSGGFRFLPGDLALISY